MFENLGDYIKFEGDKAQPERQFPNDDMETEDEKSEIEVMDNQDEFSDYHEFTFEDLKKLNNMRMDKYAGGL